MKQSVQNKINSIKAMSGIKTAKVNGSEAKSVPGRIINDSLSRAIRSKKDADIFQNELKIAIAKARNKR
jgi:hypothetical protein